jgi:hypothetical protein
MWVIVGGWAGCSVNFTFRGTGIAAVQASGCGSLNVLLDGKPQGYFAEYPQVGVILSSSSCNHNLYVPVAPLLLA